MKNSIKRLIALAVAAALMLSLAPAALAEGSLLAQVRLAARVKDIITVDNLQFKDLNDNGELDPYEDWRLSPEERAENLLSQMDATQKAAQMVHLTMVTKKDSWFSHIAVEVPGENTSAEWLEAVSEEDYNAL